MIPEQERREILEYEDFITDVTRRRSPSSKKVWWESAPLISSATAVLTVALTAYFGFLVHRSLRSNDVANHQVEGPNSAIVTVVEAWDFA